MVVRYIVGGEVHGEAATWSLVFQCVIEANARGVIQVEVRRRLSNKEERDQRNEESCASSHFNFQLGFIL